MPRTSSSTLKPKITRAEQVRQRLAEEIAAGVLAPGTRLDEIEQSLRLGVSRTPLREALRQLTALGLVRGMAHRGVIVADGVSPHMAEALAELEALCACRAGRRMSGGERRELRRVASQGGNPLELIHASAGNPVLVRFAETLWQPLTGSAGTTHLCGDDLHPLGQRLAEAVAEGEVAAIAEAARRYVDACVTVVTGRRQL